MLCISNTPQMTHNVQHNTHVMIPPLSQTFWELSVGRPPSIRTLSWSWCICLHCSI